MLSNQLVLEQKQILTQAQQQSLEILTMHTMELSSFLQNEYLENPLLEHTEDGQGMIQVRDISDYYESNVKGWDSYSDTSEQKTGYEIPDQREETIRDMVWWQLDEKTLSRTEKLAVEYLIQCLKPDGYLNQYWDELPSGLDIPPEVLETCLKKLQSLDPPGVFARDLKECLLVQLDRSEEESPFLRTIIENYLEEVAAGRISTISRGMGLSTVEVRKLIAQIERMNPRPLAGCSEEKSGYVLPDVIVRKLDGVWQAELNDSWVNSYRISDYYLKMLDQVQDTELSEYFKEKLRRIRFIMDCISQRRETLNRLVGAVLEKQKDFFEGSGSLAPMTMSQIAESLDCHVSTVSRAVKGKYLQYPGGCVEMKTLFSAAVSKERSEGQQELSASGIKELLQDYIRQEDKAKPYSDEKLRELLENAGIKISRRVVAKYREELGIKTSYARKEV